HAQMHRPRVVSPEDRTRLGGAIGFIGDYESERALCMYFLAQNGLKVKVWGPNWQKCPFRHPNLEIQYNGVWADDYVKAICSFEINLGFLRKVNRDLSTTRSLEIPACGGFFLAERTADHMALFKEGKEAEFFDSPEELLKKARFYLQNSEKRCEIAENGRRKCIESGYSYEHRLEETLEVLRKEFPNGRLD
ncbi:MAG: hypothetical protein JWM16_628, partial [Verrucomicrobiales bacterium]|nr:hypothetical protein [Verrucomicrobiales bacterium]